MVFRGPIDFDTQKKTGAQRLRSNSRKFTRQEVLLRQTSIIPATGTIVAKVASTVERRVIHTRVGVETGITPRTRRVISSTIQRIAATLRVERAEIPVLLRSQRSLIG